jgi:hypothetical protein
MKSVRNITVLALLAGGLTVLSTLTIFVFASRVSPAHIAADGDPFVTGIYSWSSLFWASLYWYASRFRESPKRLMAQRNEEHDPGNVSQCGGVILSG